MDVAVVIPVPKRSNRISGWRKAGTDWKGYQSEMQTSCIQYPGSVLISSNFASYLISVRTVDRLTTETKILRCVFEPIWVNGNLASAVNFLPW